MSDSWSFTQVWNEALDAMPERETEPREHIWASELGRGYYDRYFKMHGRQPTTPPNLRSRRKFEAGNLTEWVVQQILMRANVLRSTQDYIINEDYGMKVTGRLDFLAGGEIQEIDESYLEGLPDNFKQYAQVTIARLKELYPEGMREQIMELKSCAGMMFDRYEIAVSPHHALQCFHYSHNTKIPGMVEYVSRDDLRMCAHPILPEHQGLLALYKQDIQRMKEVYEMSEAEVIEAMKQPLLTWDDQTQKFKKNFEVEYSLYLTDYGFEYPEQYAKPAQSMATRGSNIIKRINEGKPMSKVNLATIEEVGKFEPLALAIITAKLEEAAQKIESDNAAVALEEESK
jgi:hypothetical protein